MGTQEQVTAVEQVSVLLWLKALNDFKGEGYEDSTFNEKYEAFENVEDTGISREMYDACVDFWIAKNILKRDNITEELFITEQGKNLFAFIDSKGAESSNEVKDIICYTSKKPTPINKIIEIIKKHPQETLMIISGALQAAQIVATIIFH